MKLTLIPIVLMALTQEAAAQQVTGGWRIESTNVVSPSNPSTTVEVWAQWSRPTGGYDAFVAGNFDLAATEGALSAPTIIIPQPVGMPLNQPGAVSPNGMAVRGVELSQGVFAGIPQVNPILVWTATWITTDFSPRTVDLSTENTTNFVIGKDSVNFIQGRQLFPNDFVPGAGVIEVVPSPASALPMMLVGAGLLRRRRSR